MGVAVNGERAKHVSLTKSIVSAYLSKNSICAADLPELLAQVHAALARLSASVPTNPEGGKVSPTRIRKSITPDALISFIDGKPYKTLKRHLTTHGLDIAAYRARYGLPTDYPAVSANYSATRSTLAKQLGLGRRRRKPAQQVVE